MKTIAKQVIIKTMILDKTKITPDTVIAIKFKVKNNKFKYLIINYNKITLNRIEDICRDNELVNYIEYLNFDTISSTVFMDNVKHTTLLQTIYKQIPKTGTFKINIADKNISHAFEIYCKKEDDYIIANNINTVVISE